MEQSAAIRQLLCPRQRWTNDKLVTNCQDCQKLFVPLFVWKHHCRFCGRVFCNNCASNIMTGESINYDAQKRLRHCKSCRARIQAVLQTEGRDYSRKSDIFNTEDTLINIEIDEPDANNTQQCQTQQSLVCFLSQHKLTLEHQALALLKNLSLQLCQKLGLEIQTWHLRLPEIAWQAAVQTKPAIFIRKQPWNLQKQVKIVTIIAPTEAVAAVCVKGLVLERNMPSRQLETHMKFAKIVTIKTALQADSLMRANKSGTMRFDEMVRNESSILANYLEKVFKLCPKIIFVQQQVSKAALEISLQKGIMVISKVHAQDLDKIERLALIRKRIDNMLALDICNGSEFVGCCPKVYFKNVRSGEMLLFLQHEAGIRTILLGDTTPQSNQVLKKAFSVLLQAAWNLKLERQVALRDVKLCQSNQQCSPYITSPFQERKYGSEEQFGSAQEISLFKMVYSTKKLEILAKPFQEYCKLRNRSRFLQICGSAKWSVNKLYCGQHLSLGTFILKRAIELEQGCLYCNYRHFIRYLVDQYSVNISFQLDPQGKPLRFLMREEEYEPEEEDIMLNQQENEKENSRLHQIFTQFIKAYQLETNQPHLKLRFIMYFRCEGCRKPVNNSTAKLGNDFLLIDFGHFLSLLTSAHSQTSQLPLQCGCSNKEVVRVIQGPRVAVSFQIKRQSKYQLLPVELGPAGLKGLLIKDQKMVSDLFGKLLAQKFGCVQSLEAEVSKLPFFTGSSLTSFSASSSPLYQPLFKVQDILQNTRLFLNQIGQTIDIEIQKGLKDWTKFLRQYAKIDHVFKRTYECINFIANSLKKQKLQENSNIPTEQIQQLYVTSFQEKSTPTLRKHSEIKSECQLQGQLKTQSIVSMTNLGASSAPLRMRKQTSVYLESEFDSYYKRLSNQRYLLYQGAILYYPIARIDDSVSLLACCLNSDELQDNLQEKKYKDEIRIKMGFGRDLESDWLLCSEINKVYRELTKEDQKKRENQEIQFSIYFHNEFQALRASEGIDSTLYVRSLYGCQSWDSSGGKSNSSFYKAYNDTLVVKIINQKEFVQFQKFAPAYLKYMRYKRQTNHESFLAKIYGIYEVFIKNKVYKCVVMQNLFFGIDKITQVYDLKGSEVNRLAQPPPDKSFTGLDTNFIIDKDGKPYLLNSSVYDKTIAALCQDAQFLKEQGVIDYSLLVIESQLSLRMAIIDFMRPYHFVEKIETIYKEIKSGKDPTVVPPQQYADRFVRAMKRYFAKTGN